MTPSLLKTNKIFNFINICLAGLIFSGLFSCKNKETDLGADLVDRSNAYGLETKTDFNIKTYTVSGDSFPSDSLNYYILGAVNDPYFGKSRASFVTQFLPEQFNYDFGTAPKFDSLVAYIRFDPAVSTFGKLNTKQTIRAYRVKDHISPGRFYSNGNVPYSDEIGSFSGNINTTDSIWIKKGISKEKLPPAIRIPLKTSFGQSLISQPAATFQTNTAFLDFLKGIAIVPDFNGLIPGEGALFGIRPQSIFTLMRLYYNDSLYRDFILNNESRKIQFFKIQDQDQAIVNQKNNPGQHYDQTYVQALGGAKMKIEISNLLDMAKLGNVLINDAYLTIPVKNGTGLDPYAPPVFLYLSEPDSSTKLNSPIIDYKQLLSTSQQLSQTANYGGVYNAAKGEYTYRITRHLQWLVFDYLNYGKDRNRGFYLSVQPNSTLKPGRVIFDTGQSLGNPKLKLTVHYTKLN